MEPKKVSKMCEENDNTFWVENESMIEKLKEVKEKTLYGEKWVNALKEIFGQSLYTIEKHENFIIFEYDKNNSDFMWESMECFDKLVAMIKTCKEYEEFKTFSQDK